MRGWHRMQGLLGSYVWDWKDLRARLPALAAAWLPGDGADLIGPGIAIDETADLKAGDVTACVAPQHAGVTELGGELRDHRVLRLRHPGRAGLGRLRRVHARTLGEGHAPPPRGRDPGRPGVRHQADSSRSGNWNGWSRRGCRCGGPPPTKCTAAAASCGKRAGKPGSRRRSSCPATSPSPPRLATPSPPKRPSRTRCSNGGPAATGSKGPRYSDWSLVATADPRESLLIRRLISRPDQYTFYLCYAPEGRPATLTYFVTIAGRRWPVEVGHRWYWSSCAAFSWLCSLFLVGFLFLFWRCPAGAGVEAGRACPALA